MATDGIRLLWNPDFVESLTVPELATVLAHEAEHVALLHPFRRDHRDPVKWNFATDYVINGNLDLENQKAKNAGKSAPFPFPKCGCLLDHALSDGKGSEEVYNNLPTPPPGSGKKPGNQPGGQPGQPGIGDVLDAPDKDEDGNDREAQSAAWKVKISQCAQAAKMQGKLPSHLEKMVDEIVNPPAPWQQILRRFITIRAKEDYSWKRPNRKMIHRGLYLPSLDSLRCGKIAAAIDTSGSIYGPVLDQFLSEIQAILDEVKPEEIRVIQCDADIADDRTYSPGDLLKTDFRFKGGGGTDFRPVFEALETDPPIALVYLTDGYGQFPDGASFPVLWAMVTDEQPPFGEIVRISV